MTGGSRSTADDEELTLFSAAPVEFVSKRLRSMACPSASRFPLNLPPRRVRYVVVAELVAGGELLAVAGYTSLPEVVEVTARWAKQGDKADR